MALKHNMWLHRYMLVQTTLYNVSMDHLYQNYLQKTLPCQSKHPLEVAAFVDGLFWFLELC